MKLMSNGITVEAEALADIARFKAAGYIEVKNSFDPDHSVKKAKAEPEVEEDSEDNKFIPPVLPAGRGG